MRAPFASLLTLLAVATPVTLATPIFLATPAWADEETLTVATGGAFTSMDPHYHNLGPNNSVANYVFEPLVKFDAQFHPTPGLAASWRAVDANTWEFKLQPDAKFQDGTPFTADDVVFTFGRIPQVLNSPSSFTFATKPVVRFDIPDPHTIRMTTAEPAPLFPLIVIAPMIVSRKNGEGATTADYNSGRATIGTGPYKLVSAALGDRVIFKRNDNWWGGKAAYANVVYRMIPNDAARSASLQAGDVDVIDQVPTRDVASLRTNPKLEILSAPGQRLIYLYVDYREQSPGITDLDGKPIPNPQRDLRVRRALSLAINRAGIRDRIMDGFSAPTGQLMPEGASGYDPAIQPDAYDLDTAKKLLAAAGYPNGFAITLQGPNDRYVNDRSIVEAIAQMWTRAGLKVTVDTKPASMFFAAASRDELGIDLTGWSSDTGEASSNLITLVASSNPAKGRGAVLRPSHYANPKADEIIERAIATLDVTAREALYRDATKIGADDMAFIPIHHQVNVWATRKGVPFHPRMVEGIRPQNFLPGQ